MIVELAKTIGGWLFSRWGDRRRLQVLVHRAVFTRSDREAYFINVVNVSRDREIEITHVWFDCEPQVPAMQPDRPLPKRLKPDETWETWVEVADLPGHVRDDAYTLARVRLSPGRIVKSSKNESVPESGHVPGGEITPK